MMGLMDPSRRALDWEFDPLEALARWPVDRRVALLHSGRFDEHWARWSILAEPAGCYQFDAIGYGQSQWQGGEALKPQGAWRHHPFADLRRVIHCDKTATGMWIGYLSYDLRAWIEKSSPCVADDRHWPIMQWAWCPGYLLYDTAQKRWFACGDYALDGEPDLHAAQPQQADYAADRPISVFTRDRYEAAVSKVLDYIAAGDVFQVNLAQRFTCGLSGDFPLAQRTLYRRLAATSPAWYGAYLELDARHIIASVSPELFLSVDQDRQVITRPIKGTRPASVRVDELRNSAKDIAELNMIVDLMRNDLGRVCAYGTVSVPQPRVIESHPTIHHGVATITGQLHPRYDIIHLLRATTPGGSVTGAPKVRAMQIIDELEPVRRGPYCGCIGYFTGDTACFSIAIRTMLLDAVEGRVDYSVGGGIVADSDPASEYQETLDKAVAMRTALSESLPVERDEAVRHRALV